jgi:hypothetical protein
MANEWPYIEIAAMKIGLPELDSQAPKLELSTWGKAAIDPFPPHMQSISHVSQVLLLVSQPRGKVFRIASLGQCGNHLWIDSSNVRILARTLLQGR